MADLPERYRAKLVNSLSGFKPLNLVGTMDADKQLNLAIVSSVVHLGAHPPLMMHVSRPDSVDRHTLHNIRESKCYTYNAVTTTHYQESHQTSARYPKECSEFEAVGLTPLFFDDFPAPFVQESPLKIALKLQQEITLEQNGCHLLIGEIQFIQFPKICLQSDGHLDLETMGIACANGLDSYHKTLKLDRLSYAKPNQRPQSLKNINGNNTTDKKE